MLVVLLPAAAAAAGLARPWRAPERKRLAVFSLAARLAMTSLMEQVVALDGREVLRHDLGAAPGSDWLTVPLGPLKDGASRTLTLSVVALRPEPGLGWGLTANTAFRLAYAGAAD